MNPKEVLLQQLNTIALFTGATGIRLFHCNVQKLVPDLAIGHAVVGDITPPFDGKEAIPSACGNLSWQQLDQNTLCIAINDDCAHSNYDVFANSDAAKGNVELSRRTPVQRHQADHWLHLLISYSDGIPAWLSGEEMAASLSANHTQMVALKQILYAFCGQAELVADYASVMSDPLTNLCSRTVLVNTLARMSAQHSTGLVMLHCIDFHQINKKFGHDYGDRVIREIAEQLKNVTRDDDVLCRFGGALFGVAFPANEKTNVASLAKKLQQTLQELQFLDGAISLFFDIGAAIVDFDETFSSDKDCASALINRCDAALKAAQQENQPSIITWQKDDFSLFQQEFNYLGGIFTADTVTDYRNMLLLWDISSLIADKHEFTELLQSVVQRLAQTFDFICAGLIGDTEHDVDTHKFSIDKDDSAVELSNRDRSFLPELTQMQQSALASKKPSERFVGNARILLLPLDSQHSDCFFICGPSEHFAVTHDTKVLLSGLTRQLGKALRRSRLEEELNRKLESENAQLQQELAQLKVGLQVSSLVFQSQTMHNLMKHAKRAAMTDTTVLITGESGTGKERLINALHQMGNRSDKPLVIVDCGSIPETLIESELFGHIKGAFTGAQNTSNGKILDADGGVLVLDEIGELPLLMQTKLLRFVQEKHFTPVGSSKVITVDVKIVAVTNRDLAQEVELGTFRKDLYYRLNVLTLHNPPLRERSDDISILSTHFLAKFSEQFGVEKKILSTDALERMTTYSWPGNIRELENRLMQATLLCEGNIIEWQLLNINDAPQNHTSGSASTGIAITASSNAADTQSSQTAIRPTVNRPPAAQESQPTPVPITPETLNSPPRFIDSQQCLADLLTLLKEQLTIASQHPHFFNAPFGAWIEDELIIKTYLATDRKMRLTAARLCISQSTTRRKVDKILAEGDYTRPDNWQIISDALLPIAQGHVAVSDCVAKVKLVVLEAVLSTPVYNMAQAAEMMGVSEPTFYKLKKELEALT